MKGKMKKKKSHSGLQAFFTLWNSRRHASFINIASLSSRDFIHTEDFKIKDE